MFGCLALNLLLLAVLQDPADEQIDEFRRYYGPGRTVAEKVEAIHVLQGLDKLAAAQALMDAADDPESPVREACVTVLGEYRSGPVQEFLTQVATGRGNSAVRSVAIESLGRSNARASLPELLPLLGDKDFEVLRVSVRAMGDLQAFEAIPALVELVQEASEEAIQTAALDTLGRLGQPESCIEAVAAATEAKTWQVRAAALQALGKLRDLRAIPPLIAAMEREEGRLDDDAAASLKALTGNDYGTYAESWRSWWDGIQDRYKLPTVDELEAAAAARAKNQAAYDPLPKDGFMGVKTASRYIVFCIDVSGSMEDIIQDKSTFRLADRGFRSFEKMEIVKEELVRSIEALEPNVHFNILAFATQVDPWKRSLVAANAVNKSGAVKWIRKLAPIGGSSQSFRARAGLSSAGVQEGKTNTYAVLMEALEASGRGDAVDKNYGGKLVDTIFLLSDGSPTIGEYLEDDDILAEVRRVNGLRKVAIHTIAIGEMSHHLLMELASQNGGTFVDLGK